MTDSDKIPSIRRLVSVAAIGSTLAISVAAGPSTAAAEPQAATTFQRQQMQQAVRNMDRKTILGVQKNRVNARGSSMDVPKIDYSSLSCPSKCIYTCD
jgi:hypothetical protein